MPQDQDAKLQPDPPRGIWDSSRAKPEVAPSTYGGSSDAVASGPVGPRQRGSGGAEPDLDLLPLQPGCKPGLGGGVGTGLDAKRACFEDLSGQGLTVVEPSSEFGYGPGSDPRTKVWHHAPHLDRDEQLARKLQEEEVRLAGKGGRQEGDRVGEVIQRGTPRKPSNATLERYFKRQKP